MIYVLTPDRADIGNGRETFFMNQMRVQQQVVSSKKTDFEIGKRSFEMGGRKKGQRQIADVAEGYIVKDDLGTGYGNTIPLLAFVLNY